MLTRPRSMLALAGVYAGSRGLGLVREIGVAFYFGTSAVSDRLAAAFVVASLASTLTGEAAYAASVRWLGDRGATEPGPDSDLVFRQLLRGTARVALWTSLVYAAVGPVVTLLVLGRFGAGAGATLLLSISLLPTVGASVLASCFNARLTLQRRFLLINGAQTLYSIGALIGLLVIHFAGAKIGPEPIALGWSLGNIAALLLVYRAARSHSRDTTAEPPSMSDLARIGLPMAIAYSLVGIEGLTDQTVAARLGTGSVAALQYANRLFLLPLGFVLGVLGPIVLGSLTSARRRGPEQLARSAGRDLALLARTIGPISVVFAGSVPLLVALVFQYGAFTRHSSAATTAALDGFSVGIAAVGLSLILFRAMQALAQLRTIVFVSAISVVLNAVLSVALAVAFGLYGDTLATSVAALITIQTQALALRRSLGADWYRGTIRAATLPVFMSCLAALMVVTANRAHALTNVAALCVGLAVAGILVLLFPPRRG